MSKQFKSLSKYYQKALAKSIRFNQLCYYCGCEATDTDFCPPLSHCELVIEFSETADFIAVPSCYECNALLANERDLLLSDRAKKLKRKLAQKYAQAVRVFHIWEQDELSQMSPEFHTSIAAGMRLGKETQDRLDFPNYTLEVAGASVATPHARSEFFVGEQCFDSFKAALEHCYSNYTLQKGKFYTLLVEECEGDFDKALSQYMHRFKKPTEAAPSLDRIKEFAKQHKQNSDFVARASTQLLKRYPELDLEGALAKLYEDYIAQ
ncbi:hypothetical protein CWB96_19265 [Pseudoalteromonas citrea]|uniref:Uncharacterized protein n=1 Tax=Pseudoalteromonas citrea TaxID=43655 RepID=A0A5S3XJJ0_9GAMM|nr:hypothetical protein [Pseudoalteromonas citrea]TMP41938.1 hypothetical protein CWB97_13325 [Pseudoalteromonas citrea]TMP54484.1 hypothetical protein CWB96_19265 [Pseudoalteromonas citrea]